MQSNKFSAERAGNKKPDWPVRGKRGSGEPLPTVLFSGTCLIMLLSDR